MIKLLLLTTLLNTAEIEAIYPDPVKLEASRKRGKSNRGRKRGGNGLR